MCGKVCGGCIDFIGKSKYDVYYGVIRMCFWLIFEWLQRIKMWFLLSKRSRWDKDVILPSYVTEALIDWNFLMKVCIVVMLVLFSEWRFKVYRYFIWKLAFVNMLLGSDLLGNRLILRVKAIGVKLSSLVCMLGNRWLRNIMLD